jgi:hypothetical protein
MGATIVSREILLQEQGTGALARSENCIVMAQMAVSLWHR